MTETFWQDRRVLVTGATGLLGSWLVKKLVTKRADVVALVRDWVPGSELVRGGDLARCNVVRGDVCDQPLIERTMGEYEVDTVFHLAAQTIVKVANANPISTFSSNIQGTWVMLEATRRSPTVKQFVLASSDKAYGDQDVLPYEETAPLQGRHPYDVSKSAADLIARSYAKTYGTPVAITRCGNLFGGGDLNWNRVIPGTIRSIVRDQRPIIRSDGQAIRDYFYVEDAVDAYLTLARALAQRPALRGSAFNFSNESPVTVLEIVQRILKLMGSNVTPEVLNIATNEIKDQYLSARKAHAELQWRPRFSLDDGLTSTIAWYRAHLMEASS